MTGGGTSRCLQTTEAGGMGEGWSDAMAEWTEHSSSAVSDFVLGQYVTNNSKGIRHYPYSTSTSVNPLRYSTLKTLNEVHYIGEAWANLLHNVYASLVSTYGWTANPRTTPSGTGGNVVFLHLFIDALALQPCNPTCKLLFCLLTNRAGLTDLCLSPSQSPPLVMPGSKLMPTGTVVRTSACSGRLSPAGVSVSVLPVTPTAPQFPLAVKRCDHVSYCNLYTFTIKNVVLGVSLDYRNKNTHSKSSSAV
jgi:hypothetical protein